MADNQAGQERLLKEIVGTFRCQFCRRAFEREHVRVAARHEQLWIVSVRCSLCRNQQVFWMALRDNEDEAPCDPTDDERRRFAAMPPIGSDDILDMHQFLAAFTGDFKTLLEE